MINVLLRWAIPLGALFIVGPFAAWMVYDLRAADGSSQVSLLVSNSPIKGLIAGVIAIALALGAGVLGARYIEQRSGLMAAGLVLAWAAWSTGQVDRILARTRSSGTLWTLAIEAAVLGVLAIAAALIILRIPTRVPKFIAAGDATRDLRARSHHEPTTLFDASAPLALAAAAIAAGVGAWFVAADTLKGQTFAAAAVAALLAGVAGKMTSQRVTPAWFLLGVVLVAVIGPVAATFAHGGSMGPTRAALGGRLFPLARPLPLDWIAGAFVGLPLGLWWASSMIEKHEPK